MSVNGWREVKLEDVTSKIFSGGTPNTKNKEFWNGHLPWLSSGETRNRYIFCAEKKITDKAVKNSSTRLAKTNDVVIASAGQGYTRGQTSLCKIDTYINQSLIALRSSENLLNPFFLFYNLSNRYDELRQISYSNSIRGSLTTKLIKKMNISLPPLQEQKAIAATLSCLDDKIELNNRMNQTLEEMAQALFKSWFVDFEPFQDGEFVDSELGRIPKGWSVGTIKELTTEMKNGGTPSRKKSIYWESRDFPWIKTGEIKNNILIEAEEWISKEGLANSSAKLLPKNTVLIALYGATAGQVGFLKFKASTNQACCGMICDSENKAVFLYLYLLHNQKYISSLSVGAAQQNLSKDTVSKLKLIIPTDEVLEKTIFKVLFSNIEKNIKENQKLNQLRNTFLPKLMSGEVRVPIPEVK
ncbi:MAG: type restriction enzyme subunit [Thermotogaceae bacterium]|nr:type restriction enzyme subunit [Thermotogaceae bacterium]